MKKKQARCRFCRRFMGKNHNESHCMVDGWEDDKVKIVSEEQCKVCERFDSKYIEYPLTIKGINNAKIETSCLGHTCGTVCEVRPCGEEYGGRSYIGIYLGDLPIFITSSYNKGNGMLENGTVNNPAIFVPDLKKIIYGCECWWTTLESLQEFGGFSKEDIEHTWYMKMLLKLLGEEENVLGNNKKE